MPTRSSITAAAAAMRRCRRRWSRDHSRHIWLPPPVVHIVVGWSPEGLVGLAGKPSPSPAGSCWRNLGSSRSSGAHETGDSPLIPRRPRSRRGPRSASSAAGLGCGEFAKEYSRCVLPPAQFNSRMLGKFQSAFVAAAAHQCRARRPVCSSTMQRKTSALRSTNLVDGSSPNSIPPKGTR